MRKFYEKVLPSQGVYCVTGIKNEVSKNKFAETLDDFLSLIESFKSKDENVFFNPASFNGHSRKNENAAFIKSFFVDLDIGEDKYADQNAALEGLARFLDSSGLPEPVVIDSGRGIHAYWLFDEDIPVDTWKPYAEKFKAYCLDKGLLIDPVVTAHQGRIMRCPDTENHKTTPPSPTSIMSEINVYDFAEFKEFLGEIPESIQSLLATLPKGLDEDTRAIRGLDNFETTFEKIMIRTMVEGDGCKQLYEVASNPNDIHYDQWTAALSIAIKCDDGDEAIHKISEDYHGYNREATIEKANEFEGPRTCQWYAENFPQHCEGCAHRGKITTPLLLGRSLKIARQPSDNPPTEGVPEPVRNPQSTKALPQALYPFVRGEASGIYFVPPDKFDKNGTRITEDPVLVSRYDLYPIKRFFSSIDGECMTMRLELPNDAAREFILPLKHVYSTEKFKEILSSNGVVIPIGNGANHLMAYVTKWCDYLIAKDAAEIMRMQMGWVDPVRSAFVLGQKEIRRDGSIANAPTSPLCREVVKFLDKAGTLEQWQASANKLNNKGFELHAFALLAGFGSVMMNYSTTSGGTIALIGKSGNAKTGALYGQLSIWGHPKNLSVVEHGATNNGLVGRYLALHNLPFGLDEAGDIDAKALGRLVHSVSHGKAKIRMQGSVNAEREHEVSASLIMTMTANHSFYDKLTLNKRDPNGEVARLIEFTVRRPQILIENPSLGKKWFDPFNYNYGHAGPEFVMALMRYSDEEVLELIDGWVTRFKKDFGDDTTFRFYENLLSVVMTAGEIANKAGIVQYNLNSIYNAVMHEMIVIRDGVVKSMVLDYEAIIGEYLNANQSSILAIKNGNVSMEPRGPLIIRAEIDKNLIYISRPDFNKYLAELQVSQKEFLFNLEKAGFTVQQPKKKLGSGWKDAAGVINVYTYAFDTTQFSRDLFKEGHIEEQTEEDAQGT